MSVLTPALRKALLAQTACNMPELAAFLEQEIDICEACQPTTACNPRILYLNTQLCLIEAAQIFARNQIDTATRSMAHNTQERFTAFTERHTDAESTATGRSCNWAAATSSQFFRRDSTDNLVAFSEGNLLHTAERLENGFDKSNRQTAGHGAHMSRVIHTLDDRQGERLAPGEGLEISKSNHASSTKGGTGPFLKLVGTKWDAIFSLDLIPPFLHPVAPGPLLDPAPPTVRTEICPDPDPLDPDEDICLIPRLKFPSYGNGFSGTHRVTISVAVPGSGALNFSLEWTVAFNFRQYYHCTASSVTGTSTTTGRDAGLGTARTIARPSENFVTSRETTYITHLVRKYGSSTRRGTTTTDGEEVQVGRAKGSAHSESDRNSKGQAFQQRRAESLTTQTNEAHLRRTETLTDDERRDKFGQIGDHLKQLWDRVFKNLVLLERQFAAVPMGGSMNCCPPTSCCTPIRNNQLWR